MADEKTAEKTEKKEEKVEKKKSPLMLIIIIVIAGLVIGGGGAVSYLMFKGKGAKDKQEVNKKDTDQHGKGGATTKDAVAIYKDNKEPLTFVVNLAGGKNYLKADIALELSNKLLEKEIDEKLPKIKDTILMILSEQTAESVADNKGKLRMKDEIMKRINSYLTAGKLENIYFIGFVVQ
jgi:flagellar protein FliL